MVVDIRVAPGSEVTLGQVLLRLDQKSFKENLDFAKAEHESARLEAEEASREMQRAQELYDRTVLSNHELETARIAEAKAKTVYAQANARLAKAESDWRYSEIRAPFDGTIINVMAEVGQSVVSDMQSTPLMVLVDQRRMLAKATIDDDQLGSVEIGKKIGVVAGGREYRGDVVVVGFEPVAVKDDKPRYEITVAFEPRDAKLRAGQKAKIKLP
jgi:multidrug efflux system membrane fusion protein